MKWTEQQQKVIDVRNKNVLVSAAAGSGKTAVLVERIITMITDESNPIDIDRLLVVTFTNAAATQMRERIAKAIENKLFVTPENTHLQKQLTLLPTASITTIHSFCLKVIRDYFHTIDLDPSFRMAEESEITLLKSDTIALILEKYYEDANENFLKFVESYSSAKSDLTLEEIILRVYDFSISYPWPKEWIDKNANVFDIESLEDLEGTLWMEGLLEYLKFIMEGLIEKNREAMALCYEPDGPEAYISAIESDKQILQSLIQGETYNEIYEFINNIKYERLSSKKQEGVQDEKKEKVKALREDIKGGIKNLQKNFYYQSLEEMLQDMKDVSNVIEVLFKISKEFIDEFALKKEEKNILDFNDLEHLALKILTKYSDGKIIPTEAALELSENFVEILVDEYQDSNLVQETIINSISRERTGNPNVFMVGDVKQSIYKFRLAMPELFMNKYNSYSTKDMMDENVSNLYQRIDLDRNFRSRDVVLNSVNDIFSQIMIKNIGGIEYNQDAFLKVGAHYESGERFTDQIECFIINDEEGDYDSKELEARAVAKRIKELIHPELGLMVLDDNTKEYRPAQYSDIVILFRSLVGWADVFIDILMQEGIPAYTDTVSGYFDALEIKTLISFLQIIDNPKQDISLTAVLHSPMFSFSTNELSLIKVQHKNRNMYDALISYMDKGEAGDLKDKVLSFLKMLEYFREMVSYKPIDEIIIEILNQTSYYNYISVLPGAKRRQANIEQLISQAIQFEKGSYKGLFHFIRYIEKLKKYDIDFGEASIIGENDNTVRIMSIHKSKGLEFPIVFVSGLNKQFNMMDTRDKILLDFDYGIGPDYIDLEKRTKSPTIIKKVIQNKIKIENLGEELRVLYVALTRAKEKLIMTGVINKIESIDAKEFYFLNILSAKSYLEWVLPALVNKGYHQSIIILEPDELMKDELSAQLFNKVDQDEILSIDKHAVYDEEARDKIREILNYQYPYTASMVLPVKLTVSELKRLGQTMEEEDSQLIIQANETKTELEVDGNIIDENIFRNRTNTSAGRGILYHKIIEKLDVLNVNSHNLDEHINQLIENSYITRDEMKSLNRNYFRSFVESQIFQRIKMAKTKGKLYNEKPFVIGIDSSEIYESNNKGELILIQGIIDTFFEEEGEFVIVDYKSDYIKIGQENILIERYQKQMEYYKKALEQITGKDVKEVIIFSLALGKEIYCVTE